MDSLRHEYDNKNPSTKLKSKLIKFKGLVEAEQPDMEQLRKAKKDIYSFATALAMRYVSDTNNAVQSKAPGDSQWGTIFYEGTNAEIVVKKMVELKTLEIQLKRAEKKMKTKDRKLENLGKLSDIFIKSNYIFNTL